MTSDYGWTCVLQVGVDIQLGNSGLTKIVVFTPFYNILNKASYDIEVAEVDVPQAEWFTILAGKLCCCLLEVVSL